MRISVQSANQIVTEIGAVIEQNINLMDEHGNIIASTDSSRMGSFHKGAKQVIDQNLPELYIKPELATNTTREGLNLPITHCGKIVGVIGITGSYENVKGYGQIVKKLTEILIDELSVQDNKKWDMRMRYRFLEEWILANGLLQGRKTLSERATALGIDISIPRRVMVISVQHLEKYINTVSGQKLMESVEIAISDFIENDDYNIILRNSAKQILLLRYCSDKEISDIAQKLCKIVKDKFEIILSIGIDSATIAEDIHDAYLQANKAWQSAITSHRSICKYDDITLELFIQEVSKQTKKEFVNKIFCQCSYDRLCHWMTILDEYFTANGSINMAADALHMHKNTFQYKLNKLKELTGLDVRQPINCAVFYMSMLFFKEIKDDL